MFYREMQDNENINVNMGNESMTNTQQMPTENQINPTQQSQMGTQDINQQEMPMGQTCPYMSQGMCSNPYMMYQQPMTMQMDSPMDYNLPQQDTSDLSDGSRQFGWGNYPYGGYPYGGYPYAGYPYSGFPYGSYYGGFYGHGGHGHHGGHGQH